MSKYEFGVFRNEITRKIIKVKGDIECRHHKGQLVISNGTHSMIIGDWDSEKIIEDPNIELANGLTRQQIKLFELHIMQMQEMNSIGTKSTESISWFENNDRYPISWFNNFISASKNYIRSPDGVIYEERTFNKMNSIH